MELNETSAKVAAFIKKRSTKNLTRNLSPLRLGTPTSSPVDRNAKFLSSFSHAPSSQICDLTVARNDGAIFPLDLSPTQSAVSSIFEYFPEDRDDNGDIRKRLKLSSRSITKLDNTKLILFQEFYTKPSSEVRSTYYKETSSSYDRSNFEYCGCARLSCNQNCFYSSHRCMYCPRRIFGYCLYDIAEATESYGCCRDCAINLLQSSKLTTTNTSTKPELPIKKQYLDHGKIDGSIINQNPNITYTSSNIL